MNTQTETNINEAIDWIQKSGGTLQDFALEQAPLYCQEIITWTLWSNAFLVGIGLIFLVLGIRLVYLNVVKLDKYDMNDSHVVKGLIGVCSCIIGSILTIANIPDLIKSITSPRVVIVEHIRKLK